MRLPGISVRSCRASAALRIRVIMGSPARLDHAGELPAKREHPETDAAKLEIAVVRARPAADLAAVPVPHLKLLRAVQLRKLFRTRHCFFLTLRPKIVSAGPIENCLCRRLARAARRGLGPLAAPSR